MSEHTKIPWRYESREGHAPTSRFVIISSEGNRIAVCSESDLNGENNVEFIVRACNCHGEFLKLCEDIEDSDVDDFFRQRLIDIIAKGKKDMISKVEICCQCHRRKLCYITENDKKDMEFYCIKCYETVPVKKLKTQSRENNDLSFGGYARFVRTLVKFPKILILLILFAGCSQSSNDLEIEAENIILDSFAWAEEEYGVPFYSDIKWDFILNNGNAGFASCCPWKIELSRSLLIIFRDDFVNEIPAHEAAHVIADTVFGPQGHNETWRDIAVILGASGDTTLFDSLID